MNVSNPRLQGVQSLPVPREEEKPSTPKTVPYVNRMEMYAAQVVDANGLKSTQVFFKMGETWYRDPNGSEWSNRLLQVDADSWLSKQLTDATRPKTVPATALQDAVDPLEGE